MKKEQILKNQVTFLDTSFSDSEFMSALEKHRAYKCFERIIEAKDVFHLNKVLYKHLHTNCLFKMHHDINAFKKVYSGAKGYKDFLDFLLLVGPYINKGTYKDLNDSLLKMAAEAEKEYVDLEKEQELKLLKDLAKKYNARLKFVQA